MQELMQNTRREPARTSEYILYGEREDSREVFTRETRTMAISSSWKLRITSSGLINFEYTWPSKFC